MKSFCCDSVFYLLSLIFLLTACSSGGDGSAGNTIRAAFNKARSFDSTVYVTVPAADGSGDTYVGGLFTTYSDTASSRIVRLNADGTVDTGFVIGTGFNGPAYSIVLAADGSGDIYVGGGFSAYNGDSSKKIARLNSDGTLDTGFSIGVSGSTNSVTSISFAIDGSDDLFIGGFFTTFQQTTTVDYMVRLNPAGALN